MREPESLDGVERRLTPLVSWDREEMSVCRTQVACEPSALDENRGSFVVRCKGVQYPMTRLPAETQNYTWTQHDIYKRISQKNYDPRRIVEW